MASTAMTAETGRTMPMVHMGMGKVAAVSFIMICWRTGEARPAHHAEEEHRRTDIDRHRQPPEQAVEQHQKHHDPRAFNSAETGGKAKEHHPDEEKARRLLGPVEEGCR